MKTRIWPKIGLRAVLALLMCLLSAPHVHPKSQSDAMPGESVTTVTAPMRPPSTRPDGNATEGRTDMPRPRGMTDAEYQRLLHYMRARQMTEPQRSDFWQNVQKMWKQFMDRLKRAAQRISEFFDRLNRGPSTRPRGGDSPAGSEDSKEDMYTRRIAKGDEIYSKRTGRRIRPEEHGLSADGRPNPSWAVRTRPVPQNEGSRQKPVPAHIPQPPVTSTSSSSETSSDRDREEIVTAAARENEIRTGARIPGKDSSSVNNKEPEKRSTEVEKEKTGTGIQVTDV